MPRASASVEPACRQAGAECTKLKLKLAEGTVSIISVPTLFQTSFLGESNSTLNTQN